jgi:two-component system, OmpR family, phosphate regulon response regulator PhoB
MSTVLLVEDDPDIRHLVAWKLTRAGLTVVEAADGFAALDQARRHPPDLVLLDLHMPRMSGFDVCRELRESPGIERVPIIVVSARARPEDVEKAWAAGASDYVTKPFSPRELLILVDAALSRVSR